MRLPILLAISALALAGCAAPKKSSPSYSPPQSAAVGRAIAATADSITTARGKAAALKPHVAPDGLQALQELSGTLEQANARAAQAGQELAFYAAKVDLQADQLSQAVASKNAALESADYWRGKQAKALREIWLWRIVATIAVGSVMAWIGLKLANRFFL